MRFKLASFGYRALVFSHCFVLVLLYKYKPVEVFKKLFINLFENNKLQKSSINTNIATLKFSNKECLQTTQIFGSLSTISS